MGEGNVDVVFRTPKLRQCYEDIDQARRSWGAQVAQKYVSRVESLYAARDLQALYQNRALRLHPLKGPEKGNFSIDLTGRWRMIIRPGASEEPITVREVSNHYGD